MFEHIYLLSPKLIRSSSSSINHVEKELNFSFPRDGKEFLESIGSGFFCDFVRVLSPEQILHETIVARTRWPNYPSSKSALAVVSTSYLESGVLLADTVEGDQIIFYPNDSNLFVLPRGDRDVYQIPKGYQDLMYWVGKNGIERGPTLYSYFYSRRDRDKKLFRYQDAAEDLEALSRQIALNLPLAVDKQVVVEHEEQRESMLFISAIGGMLSILETADSQRIFDLLVNYDKDYSGEVEDLTAALLKSGFELR